MKIKGTVMLGAALVFTWIKRRFHNSKVVGSNLPPATNF
jgi:hypothetical protein